MRHPGRSTCAAAILSVSVLVPLPGCRSAPPATVDASAVPSPPPVGHCDNTTIQATCTFAGLAPVDPTTGNPLAPDTPTGPDGTLVYEVQYALPDGGEGSPSGHVRAAPSQRAALESFFRAHPEAPCGGIIIRAPCPPGVEVNVQMPAPPVGSVVTTTPTPTERLPIPPPTAVTARPRK